MSDAVGFRDVYRQYYRIRFEIDGCVENPSQRSSGFLSLVGITYSDVQNTRSDRGFEFPWCPLCDDLPTVDDGDSIGELIGFLEILCSQQYRRPIGDERPDNLSDLRTVPRIESGSWFVEKQ